MNSSFVGCKFVDCTFNHTEVQQSEFGFATFEGCFIPYEEMAPNLPQQPKMRMGVSRSLSEAAREGGYGHQAARYRRDVIEARKKHLQGKVKKSESYYKSKYDNYDSLKAAKDLGILWLAGVVWGYGERLLRLAWVLLGLSFLVGPLMLWLVRGSLNLEEIGYIQYVMLSIDALLPAGNLSHIELVGVPAQMIAAGISFLGVLVFGLFVSALASRVQRT